jgi:predicted 3-demethylubiquinone-9 3-methyltransferase (glyoxalase superfamily)
MANKPTVTPFLWFDRNAEEAIAFYSSIFPDAEVTERTRWAEGGPMPGGTLMTARLRLAGLEFILFNGGPMYRFNEAISLLVNCETQAEVDHCWDKLTAGGQPIQCGWLKDKFGVTWQVMPSILPRLMSDKDPEKVRRVVAAMMPMQKLDIRRLQDAHAGR